ncbi:Ig domain-containing protein [Streptomyces sp. IBSNAI002]|uniref:Ig domain-containing protein n=1 Tax=Streptomyces sp. IBSNAI002 TaxID=3457500 RepID=UPI003FD5A9AD
MAAVRADRVVHAVQQVLGRGRPAGGGERLDGVVLLAGGAQSLGGVAQGLREAAAVAVGERGRVPGRPRRQAGRRRDLRNTAEGGTVPYTWSATGLPAGLSIAAATGTVTGSPTMAGAGQVTVTATDTAGKTGSTTFTWTVTEAFLADATTGVICGTPSGWGLRNATTVTDASAKKASADGHLRRLLVTRPRSSSPGTRGQEAGGDGTLSPPGLATVTRGHTGSILQFERSCSCLVWRQRCSSSSRS